MRRIQRVPDWQVFWILAVLVFLAAIITPGFAQRTVVQDAGGGRKTELRYNAAGQVTETRTLGPDGKVQGKEVLEYAPGAYVPQATSTSYWPNGQVQKITRNTYDNNSNFTGEFIQVFDESGKHTAGHRLTHDPQSNTYRCATWDVATQDYKVVECPAGEESSAAPEVARKFTQDEVNQQLTRARQASMPATKTEAAPGPAGQPGRGTNVKEVGFVLPARIRPGDRVSGSVVENPSDYEGLPEVIVTRVALPFAPSGAASTMAGWTLQLWGGPPQPADGPIALTIPPGRTDVALRFQPVGNAEAPVSKTFTLPRSPRAKMKSFISYQAPAICLKRQLCVIRGSFSGDSSKTFAAFEVRPAKIVAETSDAAFIAIPDQTEAGARALAIAEGSKTIAFPMVVAEFTIHPDRRDLAKGEALLMYPTVNGPQDVPDGEWRSGNYPASNLDAARKLIPGFQVIGGARESHPQREAEEKREAKDKLANGKAETEEDLGGEILLVVKNLTPDVVTFRESKNGTYVFHLTAASFKMGEFNYKFVVDPIKAGTFRVQSTVIPLLAPIDGQEFSITSASSPK